MTQGRIDKTIDKMRRGGLPAPTRDRPAFESGNGRQCAGCNETVTQIRTHGRCRLVRHCALPVPRRLLHRLGDVRAVERCGVVDDGPPPAPPEDTRAALESGNGRSCDGSGEPIYQVDGMDVRCRRPPVPRGLPQRLDDVHAVKAVSAAPVSRVVSPQEHPCPTSPRIGYRETGSWLPREVDRPQTLGAPRRRPWRPLGYAGATKWPPRGVWHPLSIRLRLGGVICVFAKFCVDKAFQ